MIPKEKVRKAERILQKEKTFTIDLLASLLDCSTPGARLKLKQWQAHTSYNQNGRYYALPAIPRFDENGLWDYRQIHFSRQGTLKNTVVHLVHKSSSGLSGNQIGELVKLSPRSFLHHFRDAPGLRREKHDGVYVYFSSDSDRYELQLENRLADLALGTGPLSDADAVIILAALIKGCPVGLRGKHHGVTAEQIAALPEVKERKLSPFVIRQFMERYGLLKKTPATER